MHVYIHICPDAYLYDVYIYVYMCADRHIFVCTYIHILHTCRIYACAYMHICIYISRQKCMGIFVCMYIHKYKYYTHTYVVKDECMYVQMYVCVCIYAIWMYTFWYMHTHIHSSINHWTNIVATLHIYVQLHCPCSAPIDPTVVQTYLKYLVSDTNSNKVVNKNVNKCKSTTAITNKLMCTQTYCMCGHMCKIWTCHNQNCGL